MISTRLLKLFAALFFIGVFFSACKNDCYHCVLEQINGHDAIVFPDSTINIDTVETCDRAWVKENNVPEDETYPQSWRCKKK